MAKYTKEEKAIIKAEADRVAAKVAKRKKPAPWRTGKFA